MLRCGSYCFLVFGLFIYSILVQRERRRKNSSKDKAGFSVLDGVILCVIKRDPALIKPIWKVRLLLPDEMLRECPPGLRIL
jgi:hypothetical protein